LLLWRAAIREHPSIEPIPPMPLPLPPPGALNVLLFVIDDPGVDQGRMYGADIGRPICTQTRTRRRRRR
jgi:hypothetical protein